MSLVGIRDMSLIETPPKNRLAIQTNVARFDRTLIAEAIRHEVERGGQVYFVHNRIESIYSIAELVTRLVPNVKVAVAPLVGFGEYGDGFVWFELVENEYRIRQAIFGIGRFLQDYRFLEITDSHAVVVQ